MRKSVFLRQKASPEGETKVVRLEKEKRDCLGRTKAMNKGKKVRSTTRRNRVRLQIETNDQRYHRLQHLRHERRTTSGTFRRPT